MTTTEPGANVTNAARHADESVLAVHLADRSGILLRGKERTTWLNGLVTCDLVKLGAGEGAYGLIVEKKGRIETDFFAIPSAAPAMNDTLMLAVPKDLRERVQATLDHYLIMEDVELEPIDVVFWQLHGPASREVLSALGAPFAGKIDVLGHGGGVIAVDEANAASFADTLRSAVTSAGGAVADDAVWNSVRIARGLPRFGVEFDATLYPQEAALEKLAVSFDKGCYLGQEVVYMLENRGHVKRKLVPLDIDGSVVPQSGDPVTTPEGAAVGDVKSSVVGPKGNAVAIAMIKWAQTKPGTELRVGELIAHVR
jgi:folate-binding protein YgfZ